MTSIPRPRPSAIVTAAMAVASLGVEFRSEFEQIPRPRRDHAMRIATGMLLLSFEGDSTRIDDITSRVFPSHLRYTLTQGIVEEVRRDRDVFDTIPRFSGVLDMLGGPVPPATIREILRDDLDDKNAAILLIKGLWGDNVSREDMDTAYNKKSSWERDELRLFVDFSLRASRIVHEVLAPELPTWRAKRWAVLAGAYIRRSVQNEFDLKEEFELMDTLLPTAQRLAWLRSIWVEEGEAGFRDMALIEPALASLTKEQVRNFAKHGCKESRKSAAFRSRCA